MLPGRRISSGFSTAPSPMPGYVRPCGLRFIAEALPVAGREPRYKAYWGALSIPPDRQAPRSPRLKPLLLGATADV